jgi:DnaJ-class molecular chaperone
MATKTKHKTHYDTLGVKQDASVEEIRKAYRALAKKYHPDKTGGDQQAEEKLKVINQAYDVLKSKEKRKNYDAELATAEHATRGFGGGGFSGFEGFDFYV